MSIEVETDFSGVGWGYPIGFDASGQVALATGVRKIEQAMQLILQTYPGERPMRPEFGSRLRDYVFGGATTDNAIAIAGEVRRALDYAEPRVDIVDVDVYPNQDTDGLLHIDIRYQVKDTLDERNLVFPFYTLPDQEVRD